MSNPVCRILLWTATIVVGLVRSPKLLILALLPFLGLAGVAVRLVETAGRHDSPLTRDLMFGGGLTLFALLATFLIAAAIVYVRAWRDDARGEPGRHHHTR